MSKQKSGADDALLQEIVEARMRELAKRFPKVFKALENASPALRARIVERWTKNLSSQIRTACTKQIGTWIDPDIDELEYDN